MDVDRTQRCWKDLHWHVGACPYGYLFLSVEPIWVAYYLRQQSEERNRGEQQQQQQQQQHQPACIAKTADLKQEEQQYDEGQDQESHSKDGWDMILDEIDTLFTRQNKNHVMIESLGVGTGFVRFYRVLQQKPSYRIRFIQVQAGLDTCLQRVQQRDATNHIPVPLDKVREYNELALQVQYDWALTIDNNQPASDMEIIHSIQRLLESFHD